MRQTAVYCKTNKERDIIFALLHAAGWKWCDDDVLFPPQPSSDEAPIHLVLYPDRKIISQTDNAESYEIVNATNFALGRLLKLTSKPVVIKHVTAEHDGEIADDKSYIQVGCQKISRATVEKIARAMDIS